MPNFSSQAAPGARFLQLDSSQGGPPGPQGHHAGRRTAITGHVMTGALQGAEEHKNQKAERDRGTEGQRDRGTEGQRDRGTEGQRDRER